MCVRVCVCVCVREVQLSLGSLCNTMHCIPALLPGFSLVPCILAHSPPTPCVCACQCRGSLKSPKDHFTHGITQNLHQHTLHKNYTHISPPHNRVFPQPPLTGYQGSEVKPGDTKHKENKPRWERWGEGGKGEGERDR